MSSKFLSQVCLLGVVSVLFYYYPKASWAHQPVMDEAPRWEGGYGFQFRYESFGSDELFDDDSEIDNYLGLSRNVEKKWFEGVYTFDRSKRITFKLPHINQRRRIVSADSIERQKSEGLGDLILAAPLKIYENSRAFTENFSLTPSLRIPTGKTSSDFPISDGSWDFGLSLAYSSETTRYFQLYDLFYWKNTDGKRGLDEGDEIGLDINWGYRFYTNDPLNLGATILLDISARHNERGDALTAGASGGNRTHLGPVLVFFKDNIIFRAEYKFPAYENMIGTSLSRGRELNLGVGMAF